jgi:L-fuconolactonase
VEIVDSQVHANQICPSWRTAAPDVAVKAALAAMDAVGVDAIVIDEWTGFDEKGHLLPGHYGPGGAWRQDCPFAMEAVAQYPSRFAFVGRVDESDPDLPTLMSELRKRPGCIGLRLTSQRSDVERVQAGVYQNLFELAAEHGMAIFMGLAGRPQVIAPWVERYQQLSIIVDHCGIAFPDSSVKGPQRYEGFKDVIELAAYPNVALKWSHIERVSSDGYPFDDLVPHFRAVLEAFGADRIMWASDYTQSRRLSSHPTTWSGLLHYLLDADYLSASEKEAILGGTVRRILRWQSEPN